MKNKINRSLFYGVFIIFTLFFSCKKGLDYENTMTILPDNVWKDPKLITAFLNDIYGGLMPGWPYNGETSDEGMTQAKDLSNYLRGILSVKDVQTLVSYTYIDKINFFLYNMSTVPTSVISQDLNAKLSAEAKFWRAWSYWNMVSQIGGVPIILEPQDASNVEGLYKARNKTSECVAQILKDLDDAIKVLPPTYSKEDYGRINKVAALAFKGKVLMWYASPLFNPTNDSKRWDDAYTATKEAVDVANANGFGLYEDYLGMWYKERNKEIIMVNQYFFPGHAQPNPTRFGSNVNSPILSLLLAFPKKDGSLMVLDKDKLKNDAQYNADFMTDFYTKRDTRFYTTIWCGGTPYPTPDIHPGQTVKGTLWNAWKWNASQNLYTNLYNDLSMIGSPGLTGFFDRKGLDTTLIVATSQNSQVDWPVIRYAEVLMNYGECANETGKPSEALDVLYKIRKRAGVDAGSGNNYGITANTKDDIRMAYIKERQAEFAFENKRFGDLRRLKKFNLLNAQGSRQALYLVLKPGEAVPSYSDNIMNATVRTKFKFDYIDNVDGDATYKFNLDLNHWFFPLSPDQISQSKNKLEQNKEWGGSFDPLQ